MKLRRRLGISEQAEQQIVKLMEVSLVGFFFIGLYLGETGIIINSAVGLGVIQLPAILERDYHVHMDAGLILWITAAVFFHSLGTIPLPAAVIEAVGGETDAARESLYSTIWWWDHATHMLSASLVAAAGYATARALDEHDESLTFPPAFMVVFILLLVIAFGVFWVVLEFGISQLSVVLDIGSALAQYGIGDTMLDLCFDATGGLIVAVWGGAHLGGVSDSLREQFSKRSSERDS